ncbi:MAE_28990/MAE_18760 family HEPN-like nuclease, partial [Bacillus safensis]|uniref:MAE_28990/MAE_18760 family HEPN-like nuclease n=1 Tax=Bacillus safensis TaxID=561879 RepID=UPI00227E0C90
MNRNKLLKSIENENDEFESKSHFKNLTEAKVIEEEINEQGYEEEEEEEEEEEIESAALEFLNLSEERWNEIDLLIGQIIINKENEEIYNVLCRSTVVLLVAHLEGYIKEAASALIDDLNYNVHFEDLPTSIKKTYVSSFL